MKRRFSFLILFEGDLDMIPGHLHSVEDWEKLATERVVRQTHYNTTARVIPSSRKIRFPWKEEADAKVLAEHSDAQPRTALGTLEGTAIETIRLRAEAGSGLKAVFKLSNGKALVVDVNELFDEDGMYIETDHALWEDDDASETKQS